MLRLLKNSRMTNDLDYINDTNKAHKSAHNYCYIEKSAEISRTAVHDGCSHSKVI